jgi:hypothetical protein
MFWVFFQTAIMLTKSALGQSIKALTVILSLCDSPPSITPEKANEVLISSNNSVQKMLKYCSKDNVDFQTTVFPSYVQIPCPDSIQFCSTTAWADQADNAIKKYIPIDNFIHRIYILPKGGCTFAGLGVIGPCSQQKICRVWISGHYADYPIAYFHELGHNLGLQHANYNGNEYGDLSDVMGYCCTSRCFNAAHSDILKYTQANQVLNIPLQESYNLSLGLNEYISIYDPSQFTKWFVQNRQSEGLDIVPKGFGNTVNVYSTIFTFASDSMSHLRFIMKSPGEVFRTTFDLELLNLSNSIAQIRLSPT